MCAEDFSAPCEYAGPNGWAHSISRAENQFHIRNRSHASAHVDAVHPAPIYLGVMLRLSCRLDLQDGWHWLL